MAMSDYPSRDFRFFPKTGEYSNRAALPRGPRRSKSAIERRGTICPACGEMRSMMNKCECNS